MPILPAETFVLPDDLLERPLVPDVERRWWVLHTRPRAEKAIARKLAARGTSFFLPQYQHKGHCRGRVVTSHLPLFPGYVFLNGTEEHRLHALETNLVANVLPVRDQRELREDLVKVYAMMRNGSGLSPETAIARGHRVEIVSGPFAGMEGLVLNSAKTRFAIEVRFVKQAVAIDLEGWMIRPMRQTCLAAV